MKQLAKLGFLALFAFGCGAVDGDSEDASNERIASAEQELFGAAPPKIGALCDQIHRLEHFIDVGDGVRLHVVEQFSGRSLLQAPRRAFLMMPPTLVTNQVYDTQVPGDDEGSFNSLTRAARAGYFAFALSWEGYGQSTAPADGKIVTAERSLHQAAEVVKWIRRNRGVPKVDLLGMSMGGSIAVVLGGSESPINPRTISNVVVASFVYKNFSPEVAPIFGPEFQAFLESLPGGYVDTDFETYGPVLGFAEPEMLAWGAETFPGRYAVGPTLEAFDLPMFEASLGQTRMLQLHGDLDPVTPFSDVEQFQTEYGGPSSLAVLEGGAHSPMLEPVRDEFWAETLAFVAETKKGVSLCDKFAPSP